jgi:hypothetical protein
MCGSPLYLVVLVAQWGGGGSVCRRDGTGWSLVTPGEAPGDGWLLDSKRQLCLVSVTRSPGFGC